MTADELLEIARRERPAVSYTKNKRGTAIAGRKSDDDPWQTVAMQVLTGEWVSVGELLINGQPANPQSEWL